MLASGNRVLKTRVPQKKKKKNSRVCKVSLSPSIFHRIVSYLQILHRSSPARPNQNPTNVPIKTCKTKPNKHADRNLENQTQQMHHHLILIPIIAWVQSEPPLELGFVASCYCLISLCLLLHDFVFDLSSYCGFCFCLSEIKCYRVEFTWNSSL